MLLDQKRTKRMVQIVAVVTALAFGGVIFVVIGFIAFGGDNSPSADLVAEAKSRVDANPNDPEAWEALASAYAGDNDSAQAISAARKAFQLDPGEYDRVRTLVSLQLDAGQSAQAVTVLQRYTGRPDADPEAFLFLAQQAETVGKTSLAQLSYQRFLQLEPDSPLAADVRSRLDSLESGGVATTTSP